MDKYNEYKEFMNEHEELKTGRMISNKLMFFAITVLILKGYWSRYLYQEMPYEEAKELATLICNLAFFLGLVLSIIGEFLWDFKIENVRKEVIKKYIKYVAIRILALTFIFVLFYMVL